METNEPITDQAPITTVPQPTPISPTPPMPLAQPIPTKKTPWLVIAIVVILAGVAGYFGFQNYQLRQELTGQPTPSTQPVFNSSVPTATPIATADPTGDWETFTHPTEKYQFRFPPSWTVAINKNASANTLFGPGANPESGLGGVEVREIEIEPQNFNSITQSTIIEQSPMTINGIKGFRSRISNIINGTNFVFKHTNGLIYNIYINSDNEEDLAVYDQVLSTFQFTN